MLLSSDEAELWHAWKKAGEVIMSRVTRDINAKTGLSGADYGVMSRLEDLGEGTLRQQELATSMGWDKARLSHHLSRMEERGLVQRKPAEARAILVVLTASGRKALLSARPEHARSIREHLLGRLSSVERRQLLAICEALATSGRAGA